MKKKLLIVFAALLLIATVFGPGIILNIVRQPEPAETYAYCDSFRNDYDSVRSGLQRLAADLDTEITATRWMKRMNCTSTAFISPPGMPRPTSSS
jgi:hypothetical protein